ncbi:hypothetical protein PAXINDRAFT_39838, partial [Paxillus involutus ATCC 200175]
LQGELEHCTNKGRFWRTSRKNYTGQLISIGRRQERIRHIRARTDAANKLDPVPDTQEEHHHIGKSQNYPKELTAFVQQRSNNPAANDFVLKLKTHLLPMIRQLHSEEPWIGGHHFCYARVLGIYHANIIYTGSDSRDYRPCHIKFLWVHWFELVAAPSGWAHAMLDQLRLAPVDADDTFGFIDPADILRCCHLIPAFADGRANEATGEGLICPSSHLYLFLYSFIDRDMLMRYHWGLAPGHSH